MTDDSSIFFTVEFVSTVIFAFFNILTMFSLTSSSTFNKILFSLSIIVTFVLKELKIVANSIPITPPPIITRFLGISSISSIPLLVNNLLS